MDIKIIVAAHKKYRMPNDPLYLPLQVGAVGKPDIGYTRDDTGDNISAQNPYYCELTGVYWAWKNLKADYIGLAHYRRHFCVSRKGDKFASVMTTQEAQGLCSKYKILVPNKRRYVIETIKSHWLHAPQSHKSDLDCFEAVIKEKHPDYFVAYEKVMNRTWAHMFNMFVMERSYFNDFCTWMFDVLFEVEHRTDVSQYAKMDARLYGFLGEFMPDIWIEKNEYPYHEVSVMFMENQNWLRKGGAFLFRKICNV